MVYKFWRLDGVIFHWSKVLNIFDIRVGDMNFSYGIFELLNLFWFELRIRDRWHEKVRKRNADMAYGNVFVSLLKLSECFY